MARLLLQDVWPVYRRSCCEALHKIIPQVRPCMTYGHRLVSVQNPLCGGQYLSLLFSHMTAIFPLSFKWFYYHLFWKHLIAYIQWGELAYEHIISPTFLLEITNTHSIVYCNLGKVPCVAVHNQVPAAKFCLEYIWECGDSSMAIRFLAAICFVFKSDR